MAESTAWEYCQQVAKFFVAIAPVYIKLPTPPELPALAEPLLGQQAVLFIDGMIQPIQRPAHAGEAFFCGRRGKACDGLNIQALSDQNGLIRHLLCGMPGSAHDLVAIQESPWFMQWLQNLPAPYAVVGDTAYIGLAPNVITPHRKPPRGNLTAQQRQENKQISSLRIIAERVNGLWR